MAGRASAFGDEMSSSSRIRISRWSGRPGSITGEIVTHSHPRRPAPPTPRASAHETADDPPELPDAAFVLDGPGEYEVRDVR